MLFQLQFPFIETANGMARSCFQTYSKHQIQTEKLKPIAIAFIRDHSQEICVMRKMLSLNSASIIVKLLFNIIMRLISCHASTITLEALSEVFKN